MTARKPQLVGLAVVALAVYGLMWVGFVAKWHWLDVIDRSAIDALHAYGIAHPGWVTFWDVLCTVLGPTAFRLFALVVIVFALARRNLRTAVFLVISVELSGLVSEGQRPPPTVHGRPRRWCTRQRRHFRRDMRSASWSVCWRC